MKTRFYPLVLVLVLLAVLTGCNNKTLPNFSIESNNTAYTTRQVATAMDAHGWSHTLWSECDGSASSCRLVYARYLFSRPEPETLTYITPHAGFSYQDPDIAVTDDGTAFGVWKMKVLSTGDYENCYTNLTTTNGTCTVLHPGGGVKAALSGAPRVAARGDIVYSVYELANGGGTRLEYRRLMPLDTSHPVNPPEFTMKNSDVDLAVSPAGTLHVVWKTYATAVPYTPVIRYADSVGATDLLVHQLQGSSGQVTAPSIAVSDDGFVYFLYGINNSYPVNDEMMLMYCLASNCPSKGGVQSLDLSANQPWNLRGTPALATNPQDGVDVYGAFASYNSANPSISQIFTFNFTQGNTTTTPTAITTLADYPDEKSSPRVAIVVNAPDGPNDGPAIPTILTAWRSELSVAGTGAFDVYLHESVALSTSIEKIDASPQNSYVSGDDTFDLVGAGELAGGVWIDPSGTRMVPWVTRNYDTAVYLPMMLGR